MLFIFSGYLVRKNDGKVIFGGFINYYVFRNAGSLLLLQVGTVVVMLVLFGMLFIAGANWLIF